MSGTADHENWALLRAYALKRVQGLTPAQPVLNSVSSPVSLEDRLIVEAFVAGWPHEQAKSRQPVESYVDRLLAALKTTADQAESLTRSEEPPPAMIQSELWQVLHRIRESGDLFYARESDVNELDRRIVFALHANGPLSAADICNAMGVDKAQVSRSVKRLIDGGLGERALLRSPLALTQQGREVAWRLARLAELRNRELTVGVSDDELADLFTIIEVLLDRSIALYEVERRKARSARKDADDEQASSIYALAEEGASAETLPIDRTRIISPLLTLSAYFSRSGALAYRRLTGLSAFEAFVMSEIGRNSPILWNDLVRQLRRDHSQAGRTVTALIERGLVVREGERGRRNGCFTHSEVGGSIYDIICKVAAERSVYLMTPLDQAQRKRFLSTFAKIRENADKQLERERAFANLNSLN